MLEYVDGSQIRATLTEGQMATLTFDALSMVFNTHLSNVRKRAKIKNRYNQAPHLTQDTNGKVTTSQLDITNESQEVSLFPAGDHNASTNKRA